MSAGEADRHESPVLYEPDHDPRREHDGHRADKVIVQSGLQRVTLLDFLQPVCKRHDKGRQHDSPNNHKESGLPDDRLDWFHPCHRRYPFTRSLRSIQNATASISPGVILHPSILIR